MHSSSDKRTMKCSVCLFEANQNPYPRYGENYCCKSCKVWFRRFNKVPYHPQKNLNPCLKAMKSGIPCNRRGTLSCRKCRYLACLRNGMRFESVPARNPFEFKIHDFIDMNAKNVEVILDDVDELERFFDDVAQSFF